VHKIFFVGWPVWVFIFNVINISPLGVDENPMKLAHDDEAAIEADFDEVPDTETN
jgi:hypothetical protein